MTVDASIGSEVLFFSGYIKIPADGEYIFLLTADAVALMRIHDCVVIDEYFGYPGGVERSGSIRLKQGMHPFKLYCLIKAPGNQRLIFYGVVRSLRNSKFRSRIFP